MKRDAQKKCYTGIGDKGETRLLSGERVKKCDLRVEVAGVLDELNSALGVVAAALPAKTFTCLEDVRRIQTQLFHIGARVSASAASSIAESLPGIGEDDIQALEELIDNMESQLPPLKQFILPGGHLSASFAHMARTICRKAERRLSRLTVELENGDKKALPEQIQVYLNRLSDYLFVLARYCNKVEDVPEVSLV